MPQLLQRATQAAFLIVNLYVNDDDPYDKSYPMSEPSREKSVHTCWCSRSLISLLFVLCQDLSHYFGGFSIAAISQIIC